MVEVDQRFTDGDDVDYVEGRPRRRFSCTSEERIVVARDNEEEEREREREGLAGNMTSSGTMRVGRDLPGS